MNTIMDKFGRVVIPKEVRQALDLKPGTILQVREEDHSILLKPIVEDSPVKNRNGVLIFSGKKAGDIDRSIASHRSQRLASLTYMKKE